MGYKLTARRIQGAERAVTFEPLPEEPLLSVVRNVEVCATGVEYPLASGPQTFTEQDLREAIASQDDPAVVAPRVWLGHPDDDRFHAGRATPAGSAEPAIGKVVNMRLEDNDQVLVGDIVGCPTWLAKILSSAYPSRSIEGYTEAETVTGHKWGLVITDLALLGVTWPGVSTLEDLQSLYSEDGPEGVEVEEVDEVTVTAARSITAQVNVDDVRRAFYGQLESSQMWWWIRAIQLDPNELIVDDDEGGLYRVPFTVDGEAVEFSDPEEVKIQYVNASQKRDPHARQLLVSMFVRDKQVVASFTSRADARPESPTQEDNGMTPEQIRLLRARLNLTEDQLPDDATQEQINAVLSAAPEAVTTPPVETTTPPTVTAPAGTETVAPGTVAPAPEPVAASTAQPAIPEGMTLVPSEAWTGLQAQVQGLASRTEEEDRQERTRILTAAVNDGKVFPHQREFYASRLEDPNTREAFRTLLTASVDKGGLAPNLVPVTARGADPSEGDLNTEAYPASWLPEVSQPASAPTVTMEV